MNVFSLFQRAAAGQALSPSERAALKWLQTQFISIISAASLAAASVFLNYLKQPGTVNWSLALTIAGLTLVYGVIFGFGHAIAKLISASQDPLLGNVLDQVVTEAEKQITPLQFPQVETKSASAVSTPTIAETPSVSNQRGPVSNPPQGGSVIASLTSGVSEDTVKLPAIPKQ